MKRHGIVYPWRTLRASRKAKISLASACALLEQETAGGHNVFGHDPVRSKVGGRVTMRSYLAYKRRRKMGLGMQGVGPMQLTWWEFQDRADRRGGCWRPYINMLVGFDFVRATAGSRWAKFRTYNGSGPAAARYADSVSEKRAAWARRFR